jgi:mannose-6-phosphate isomerase-like protein (cupin superfamily)
MKVVNVLDLLDQSPSGNFKDVLSFNQAVLGAVSLQGDSPFWEMHPDTDELFFVLDGALQLEVLTDDGRIINTLCANEVVVVPRGLWHKPSAPKSAKFMYLTPGRSLYSDKADPRV